MGSANEARYWAKVDVRGHDDCWPWLAASNRFGYGIFWGGGRYANGKPKMVKAHRYGFTLANGDIPAGLVVCHRCDNPACQNPAHWFLGTKGDNNRDRSRKGRSSTGPRKLTIEQVTQLRTRYANGAVSQTNLAKEYGISQTGVSLLLRS